MEKIPDRYQPLQQINGMSFVVSDLNLYLDIHPADDEALNALSRVMTQRKQFLGSFVKEYESLTLNCVYPETNNKFESHARYSGQKHFIWPNGLLPWDCLKR